MSKTIIMEQTFNILSEKNRKETLEKEILKERNEVKYLLIEENND